MEDFFIPVLHWFAMNNPYSGSEGNFRYFIRPQVVMATPKEVDFEQSQLLAEYWHGEFCYEKSEIEGKEIFPLSEEGRAAMIEWLLAKK